MDTSLGDLLAPLAAIGHAMQEPFDPQRFLAGFSTCVQSLLPHDRMMIVYLEEGGSLSVFAEHGTQGLALHEGRYTITFDPGSRYTAKELVLTGVLAGDAMHVDDFQQSSRFRSRDPMHRER